MPEPKLPNEDDAAGPKIALSESDVRDAARLLQLFAVAIDDQAGISAGAGSGAGRPDLILRARIILNSRRQRGRYFNRAMFGEPGWDILLVLYVMQSRQSIGQLAKWIETPLSTAVRWIDYLAKERLVEREPHPNDKRVMFIRLLERGRSLLDDYLSGTPWDHPQDAGAS